MEIYVSNIPKGARATEVKKLLQETLRENIFRGLFDRMVSLGRFESGISVDIIKQTSKNGDGEYRYGRLVIKSEQLARMAMDLLEGSELRGNTLGIRPYAKRSSVNDRRRADWRSIEWKHTHRRLIERRHVLN